MTGNELQEAVNNSGIPIAEILRLSGIKERTFFSLYHKPEVREHHLKKIRLAGVNLQKPAKNSKTKNEVAMSKEEVLTLQLKVAQQEIAILKHEKRLSEIEKIVKNKSGTFTKRE